MPAAAMSWLLRLQRWIEEASPLNVKSCLFYYYYIVLLFQTFEM